MNAHLECGAPFDADTVTCYVAGTLSEDDANAFEIHLLTCARCQHEVRTVAVARAALRALPAERRPARRAFWFVPLAAAAVLIMLLSRDTPLGRLGRIDAPAFEPLPVRAVGDDATRRIDEGMAAYRAGDYDLAAQRLGDTSGVPAAPGVRFFYGIALLEIGQTSRALHALTAAAQPANPYTAEAHYYSAKAWLRLGEADSARARLSLVSSSTPLHARAMALADSIRARQ